MTDRIFLTEKEIASLSVEDRIKYYSKLRDYCSKYQNSNGGNFLKRVVEDTYYKTRNFFYDFEGLENISEGPALFVANHTNPRDFLTINEAFREMGIKISTLMSKDNLGFLGQKICSTYGSILADRTDLTSVDLGTAELLGDLLSGKSGLMFGEVTMNLHPYRMMQDLQFDPIQIAFAAGVPIIPVIVEYLEVPELVETERELYNQCIIKFGKPLQFSKEEQPDSLKETLGHSMALHRGTILAEKGIIRFSIDDVSPMLYLNHTLLKKRGVLGFSYDSLYEAGLQYRLYRRQIVNEYKISCIGTLVPGVTKPSDEKKFINRPI